MPVAAAAEVAYQRSKQADSLTSLLGVALGGGLFLVVVIIGVLVWVSREREEDQVTPCRHVGGV